MWAQAGVSGVVLCGREFQNSLDESSFAEVKAAIEETDWLLPFFDIGAKYIRTICGRVSFAFAGLRHNLDSIKSKARILLVWVDEAEPVSESAWAKLIPTVRESGSEIWVTYNPESSRSATHKRFRADQPESAIVVELNWRDNPWFPAVLDAERREDEAKRPDSYQWIWEGGFNDNPAGAYFAAPILAMRQEHRLGVVAPDPLLPVQTFWDIGGTGVRSDARAIWVAQRVGQQIRVLDYRETQGQPLAVDVQWMRDHRLDLTSCVLPHDGATNDRAHAVSYQSALESAGMFVEVVPNQGAGAANTRIEAGRRVFPSIWMDNRCDTDGGLAALAHYHEKRDDRRNIGLGPNHDWSSHAADAFGLMAIYFEQNPARGPRASLDQEPIAFHSGDAGWMGA